MNLALRLLGLTIVAHGTLAAIRPADTMNIEFPDKFMVNVQGAFTNEKLEMGSTLYYDKANNRAAVDILFQGEKIRQIYFYDTNQAIMIQDTTCSIEEIKEDNTFFQYYEEEDTRKKTLASPEECFFFTNSDFAEDDEGFELPMLVYKGIVNIPRYKREGCDVTHRFSKPVVTMADCIVDSCRPTLYSINVKCGVKDSFMDHSYHFSSFQRNKVDESVFQIPRGVYCPNLSSTPLPKLPKFFCSTYYITEEFPSDEDGSEDKIFLNTYREVCYDGDVKLVKVDNYKANRISSTQIYDFKNKIGVALTPALDQCDVGPTTEDLTPGEASFLPDRLFVNVDRIVSPAVYIGTRQSHGLTFQVWSSLSNSTGMDVVKDMYFLKIKSDSTKDPSFQISHIEEYYYDLDGNKRTLGKISYTSFGEMRTAPRDWSIFNISACFPDDKRKAFQITLSIHCVLRKSQSKTCPDFNFKQEVLLFDQIKERLYDKLVEFSNTSVIRVSGVQLISANKEKISYRGVVLENPMSLTDAIRDEEPESTMTEAFDNLLQKVNSGQIEFSVYTDEKVVLLKAISFVEFVQVPSNEHLGGYTRGAMAGIGIVMALIGLIIGALTYFVYMRSLNAQQQR